MTENPYRSPEAEGERAAGSDVARDRWQWVVAIVVGTAIGIGIRNATGLRWGSVAIGVLLVIGIFKAWDAARTRRA